MNKVIKILSIVLMASTLASAQLAGYWTFDETSGLSVLDSSGNSKTGSLFAADSSNYPARITGHIGNALQFNASTTGASNYNKVVVPIGGSDALVNLGEAFTISMWVRRDVVNSGVYNPGLIYTNAYELDLATNPDAIDQDAMDYFYSGVDTNWQISLDVEADAQKVLGSWYHYAVTYDGHNLRKYVNGTLIYTATAPTSFSLAATTNLFIGARDTATDYFQGAIDDVAVWSGKYLKPAEVAKLANGTSTPLTAIQSDEYIPPVYLKETDLFPGWSAVWNPEFNWDIYIVDNHPVYNTYWHFPEPNSVQGIVPVKWYIKNDANYANIPEDSTKYGMQWIDSSWNGREPNTTVLAAYITPGMVLGQNDWGYASSPAYFRTNLRIATQDAGGASARVSIYRRAFDSIPDATNYATLLTKVGDVIIPLNFGNHVWKTFTITLPKPTGSPKLWFEIAMVGGSSSSVLFIDGLKPASELSAIFKMMDLNKDSAINYRDVGIMANSWLDKANVALVDPRNGGLLTNGDFSADMLQVISTSKKVMNPTGWTFTGIGNYGVANTSQRGRIGWYYSMPNRHPVGGDVSAYTTDMVAGDSNGVLEQTASAAAVSGQTYYAMANVMAYDYVSTGQADWYGWKDTATLEIAVDGVVKASFSRLLSRSIWRPVYGTYTAVPADAGKAIKIRISYNNSYINVTGDPSGTMYIGNAYLGTTVPNEWPEKRPNLLANGGFENLTTIQSAISTLYTSLTTSDNSGAWFATGMPATSVFPNWIYEVSTGYNLINQGGVFATGYYAAPLPSPGMNDIVVYGSGTMVYGQIVGALTAGTTYYLDTACGVLIEPQTWGSVTVTWPSPAPTLHIELWRIPAGVTDPNAIHMGVTTGQSGYVKLASSDVASTGDIKPDDRKWQTIGTTYTATSSDNNVYVRVYGTNPITVGTTYPHFAFSDVYLSTQKRQIAGGALINNPAAGLQYDVLGPYNCYQAGLMGYAAPTVDLNGDCITNFVDFSLLADQWLSVGILN